MLLVLWHGGWAIFRHDLWISDQLPYRFLMSGLAIEFLLGAAIAMIADQYRPKRSWTLVGWVMLTVGVVAASQLDTGQFAISSVRAITGGLAATGLVLLCVAAKADREQDGRSCVPAAAPFVRVGDASYALYLLHPVLFGALGWWGASGGGLAKPPYSDSAAAALLLACFLVSIFWWRNVEAPVTRLVAGKTP